MLPMDGCLEAREPDATATGSALAEAGKRDGAVAPASRSRSALVVGGSIAGQLAAAALARHGFAVTILDRDRLPDAAAPRKGVPQSRHLHGLLVGGQRHLETLLPGLAASLIASGAEPLSWTHDVAVHTLAGWHRRFPSDLSSCFMSRDLLDREVRRAVAALADVRTLQGHEAMALTGTDALVTGVRCRVRGAQDDERILRADLVVDASGRESRAPDWLAGLGLGPVTETVVDAFLGYATRLCRRPEGMNADWKAMLVRSRAATTRAGAVFPIEGGRCLVTLAGFARDDPPLEDDGFLEFVRGIGVPELDAAVRAAEPLAPTVGYRRTTNRWRRYHEAERWPEGFVAVGDAVCAFNPYYGQGMAVAAMSATALADLLARRGAGPGFAREFQRGLARLLATPWLMATTEEARYPETAGAAFGWRTRANLWYTDRLLARAAHDPAVMGAFMRVSHLVEPFGALVRPRVALPVLLRPRSGDPSAPRRYAPSAAFSAASNSS